MSRRGLLTTIVAAGALLAAPRLAAQCTGVNHVTWPSANPVWDFCWVRPADSQPGNGSGIELVDVKYRGTLILARAHLPILNVKYAVNPSGCGGVNYCYRDWLYSEQDFQCSPCQAANGSNVTCSNASAVQCTGTATPAATVCESCSIAPDGCEDIGSFSGVAVEDLGTSLKLTSQCEAGWYRYIPVWEFFPDGRIEARFAATSIDATCVSYDHEHHAYFRFDFDVNGSAGNYVDEVLAGNVLSRVTTERNFTDTGSARSRWRVGGPGSPYAVEVNRNASDGAAGDPPGVPNGTGFAVADGWVLAYNANEISDYQGLSVCQANLNSFDTNQPVNGADVVLWVRAGALHEGEAGGQAAHCGIMGPTIRVLTANPAAKLNTVSPCRVVDTRDTPGAFGGPPIAGGGTRTFALAGQCGVPASARSVAVNLTVVQPGSDGFFTVYPAGGSAPVASTLNFSAGQIRANNAVLPLGEGGAIYVFNGGAGDAHLLIDVTGWFE
jgi:hypothetical protein